MIRSINFIILKVLGAIFWWLSIVASIVAIYSLYMSMSHGMPWILLCGSVIAGLVARQVTVSISGAKQRLTYVDQLMERGYVRVDAEAAWHMARNGGMNLLSNLHQVELGDEIDGLESALGIQKAENKGD